MGSQEDKTTTISAELRPLRLPEGIPDDELPKIVINVLLRRALFEKIPLSKWVLLGALEVLQGRAPKLTPTMLSQLVSQSEDGNIPSGISVNKTLYSEDKISNSFISESVGTKQVADESPGIKMLSKTKDIDVQCVEVSKESKEIQCKLKPAMLTKWVQVKHLPKLISNWSQTLIKDSKDNETQTLIKFTKDNEAQTFIKNTKANETQTLIKYTKNKETQTELQWGKLIEVSGIPKKIRVLNNHGGEDNSFYGRPLIEDSELNVEIPLNAEENLQDPRS